MDKMTNICSRFLGFTGTKFCPPKWAFVPTKFCLFVFLSQQIFVRTPPRSICPDKRQHGQNFIHLSFFSNERTNGQTAFVILSIWPFVAANGQIDKTTNPLSICSFVATNGQIVNLWNCTFRGSAGAGGGNPSQCFGPPPSWPCVAKHILPPPYPRSTRNAGIVFAWDSVYPFCSSGSTLLSWKSGATRFG